MTNPVFQITFTNLTDDNGDPLDNVVQYNDASLPAYVKLFPTVTVSFGSANPAAKLVTLVLNISNSSNSMKFGFFDAAAQTAGNAAQINGVTISPPDAQGNITITTSNTAGLSVGTWESILRGLEYQSTSYEDPTTHTITFVSATPSSGAYDLSSGAADADTLTVICFYPGTKIRTPEGEASVESLQSGDLVLTAEGAPAPVRWVGRQTVSTVFGDKRRVLPIRIKAHALGDNVPCRDLLVSADHALLVGGVLVQAGALVNGTSVVRETAVPPTFVYRHIELDDHALILAENVAAETFVDNVDRRQFDNWAEHEALYPDGKPIHELPYPRAKGHRQVPAAVRTLLQQRAEAIGATAAEQAA